MGISLVRTKKVRFLSGRRAMATMKICLDEVLQRDFHQCVMSGRILVALPGDDKVWCGSCQAAHPFSETVPSSAQAYENQKLQLMGRS
jgi:hypothetical protein